MMMKYTLKYEKKEEGDRERYCCNDYNQNIKDTSSLLDCFAHFGFAHYPNIFATMMLSNAICNDLSFLGSDLRVKPNEQGGFWDIILKCILTSKLNPILLRLWQVLPDLLQNIFVLTLRDQKCRLVFDGAKTAKIVIGHLINEPGDL